MQPGTYAPPPPPPPGAGVDAAVRPAKKWFVLAVTIVVVGIVAAIVWFAVGMMRFVETIEDFDRVDAPGSEMVTIDDPGGYTVYHEYAGADDDTSSSTTFGGGFAPSVGVSIFDPGGGELPLEPYDSEVTYQVSGHEGVAAFSFEAEQAGDYEVVVDGETGSTVAVGQGVGGTLGWTIGGPIVLGGASVVVGGVLATIVGVRRSQSRNRLIAARVPTAPPGAWAAAAGQPGGPPPGAPGGWAPPVPPPGGTPPAPPAPPPPPAGGTPPPPPPPGPGGQTF